PHRIPQLAEDPRPARWSARAGRAAVDPRARRGLPAAIAAAPGPAERLRRLGHRLPRGDPRAAFPERIAAERLVSGRPADLPGGEEPAPPAADLGRRRGDD